MIFDESLAKMARPLTLITRVPTELGVTVCSLGEVLMTTRGFWTAQFDSEHIESGRNTQWKNFAKASTEALCTYLNQVCVMHVCHLQRSLVISAIAACAATYRV